MTNKPWQDKLIDIEPYVAGEQPQSADIIKLNANENPYPPSPSAAAAIREFDGNTLKKYPPIKPTELRNAVAEHYALDSSCVFSGNGSDDVLAAAFRAFFNSDMPILFPDITYSFYPVWCSLMKIPYKVLPVDENFEINIEDYAQPNGGVVIPNPNAPTAIGFGEEKIRRLLDLNRDCIVIIDEAYADFSGYSCVGLIKEYDNLVVTQTFSKSRSLAGMRVAAAMADPYLISYLDAVKDSYNSYPLDSIAVKAGTAAVRDEEYFRIVTDKIIATRQRVSEEMKELGFILTDSRTNFIFARHVSLSAKEIFEYLKSKGVYVRHFDLPRIDNYLRITIGTDEDMDTMLALLRSMPGILQG